VSGLATNGAEFFKTVSKAKEAVADANLESAKAEPQGSSMALNTHNMASGSTGGMLPAGQAASRPSHH